MSGLETPKANDWSFLVALRPLQEMRRSDQLKLRRIRNQPGVRKNMYCSDEISEAEHLAWLGRDDDSTKFFGVFSRDELIGGVSLNVINQANKRADWAFYLSESRQGSGLGLMLEFLFLDYAFGEAGLEKLNCEVLDFNAPVIRFHEKFGFVREGVRRRHIERGGETFDAVLLGITKQEWLDRRPTMELKVEWVWRTRWGGPDPAECGDVFA